MIVRLRHPVLTALVCAPLALAAEPAVGAPAVAPVPAAPVAFAPPEDPRHRLDRLCGLVAVAYDSARGGFVGKDGVPSEDAIELALRLGREPGGAEWRRRALETLDWTRSLLDTLSGGYMTRRPKSSAMGPAFEMRSDVNGRRLSLLVQAWQETGEERYRRDAARVADFMDRVLLDGRGGFVAAQVGDRTLEPAVNGVAIRAWLAWAAANGDRQARDFALRSIDRVWDTCFDPLGVLLRRGSLGELASAPRLDDQVEMGRALLVSWRLTGRAKDLERAHLLGRVILLKFEDPKRGGFMTQARPTKDGAVRRAARVPEENARTAAFLVELAAATGERSFEEAARRTWPAFEREERKMGLAAAAWALAVQALVAPERPAAPDWQAAARERPATPQVIRFRPGKGKR